MPAASPDLNIQQLSPNQTPVMPFPNTIVAAASIAPTHRFTRITGATPITTIVPPTLAYHELVFVATTGTAGHFATGGNIATAKTTVANVPLVLYYDPRTALYY